MYEIIKIWKSGELETVFFKDADSDIVSMALLPAGWSKKIVPHNGPIYDTIGAKSICDTLHLTFPSVELESMIQLKFSGDGYFGQHAGGMTMRNSETVKRFKLISQNEIDNTLVSVFKSADGMVVTHTLSHPENCDFLECKTELFNGSDKSIRIEMFSSFSLGMISLLHADDAPGALKLHRFRSCWSGEALHTAETLESLNMERSWQSAGVRGERFGQRSSMVNKDFHPFAAIEDTENNIVWAASVEAAAPWQMEVVRFCDFVNISGGLPDREFNGWFRDLAPGERLTSPIALLTACSGSYEDTAKKLTSWQINSEKAPEFLTPTFNDWCSNWGVLSEERILKLAEKAKTFGVEYFIVDDGWFRRDTPGDWDLNTKCFPHGFRHLSEELHKLGMKSGIWFEFETLINLQIDTFDRKHLLLTQDGFPIKSGERHFWDFRKQKVIDHLTEKVAKFLKDNLVEYIKIDYNAPVPFGVDGSSASPAENLQQHLAAVREFHNKLHELVPGLKIEECSSGGHRLTPAWARTGDFISVSDAHESVEIPLISAQSLMLCAFDKALVWSTLRETDSDDRIAYSMCAGFLGQMTLSGDLDRLSDNQLASVGKYVDFYRKISRNLRLNSKISVSSGTVSRMYPTGHQVVTFATDDELLKVIHFFDTDEKCAVFAIPDGDWELVEKVGAERLDFNIANSQIRVDGIAPFCAAALRFKRR